MGIHQSQLPPITHKLRSDFKACPRKTFWRYVAGIETKKPTDLSLYNEALSIGIRAWREGDNKNLAAKKACDYGESFGCYFADIFMEDILGNYFTTFKNDKDAVDLDEIFTRGNQESVNIDCYITDAQKRAWIVINRIDYGNHNRLSIVMDEEVISAALILLSTGVRVKGALLRRTSECDASEFTETKHEFNPAIVEMFSHRKDETNHVIRQMLMHLNDLPDVNARRAKRPWESYSEWPWNSGSCTGSDGNCEYLELCSKQADPSKNYKPTEEGALDNGTTRKLIWGHDPKPAKKHDTPKA